MLTTISDKKFLVTLSRFVRDTVYLSVPSVPFKLSQVSPVSPTTPQEVPVSLDSVLLFFASNTRY